MRVSESTPPQGIAIWERLIPNLWFDVCALLELCRKADSAGRTPAASNEEFLAYFNLSRNRPATANRSASLRFYLSSQLRDAEGNEYPNPYMPRGTSDDEHLRIGLFERHKKRQDLLPRLAALVVNSFHQAREGHVESRDSELLPSPLFIICQFLTDPEDLASAGYAYQACRNWLSGVTRVWPSSRTDEEEETSNAFLTFGVRDLSSAMQSFENHERIQIRWPNPRYPESREPGEGEVADRQLRINWYVGHLLALKGNSNLWFRRGGRGHKGDADAFLTIPASIRSKPDARDALNALIARKLGLARFRKATQYRVFPDFEEVANQVFGVPVPIKGMDIVFDGGIRASSKGGLVISIQGAPGTGKTTFALAIANALAPFGIPTSFVALEESEDDVKNKLSFISQYRRSRLSVTQANDKQFFCIDSQGRDLNTFAALRAETELLYREVGEALQDSARQIPHVPFAGVVVIDNINMLGITGRRDGTSSREQDIDEVASMVQEWRASKLLSIVISAQDVAGDVRIDYLADVVVEMRFADLDAINRKPLRIMNLVKTRHQSARQGAHLFHMSSAKGFRLVPHMDSLMARKAGIQRRLPDRNQILDVFHVDGRRPRSNPYLKVFQGSNVLLHGFGSGGKAGLALKILARRSSPNSDTARDTTKKQRVYPPATTHLRPRVLIVSFLYPEDYYRQLLERLGSNERGQGEEDRSGSDIEPLILSPGFLTPQDFLNMVVSRLEGAAVAGRPFTGVMIDGLHNVFLQYEMLHDSSVVWAMLYSILSRYNISVVSTFTNFSLNDRLLAGSDDAGARHPATSSIEDQELMQKGMTPFLHALVKATDFYLYLQEEIEPESNKRMYVLSVRTAIGQEVPEDFLIWDRQALKFTERLKARAVRHRFLKAEGEG